MCECVQKERLNNPRVGYYDYVFQCEHDGHRHVFTITATNDSEAKGLAEDKCSELHVND